MSSGFPLPTPQTGSPSQDEVDRIARLADPVLRNLQITQCYHELSRALAVRTGAGANWCTFAAWASKQAGQSIRKEDLRRALERAVQKTPGEGQVAEEVAMQSQAAGQKRSQAEIRVALRSALDYRPTVERASDAVGRGNKKVFEEIGREFARFNAEFLQDAAPDEARLARFCETLRPGEPPDGQRYLRQAFKRYYRAFFLTEAKERAELLLCANIEIGFHEQTRLQPEIAEALDAAFTNLSLLTRHLIAASFPAYRWLAFSQWLTRRLLGRETAFDRALRMWLGAVQLQMRRALTDLMMSLQLPPDRLVKLGDDLRAVFPDTLRVLSDPDLSALLASLDPTPDSTAGSGARDWASLPDRLHFIIDLFRCYQEAPDLFADPFTPQQVAALKDGRVPAGRL